MSIEPVDKINVTSEVADKIKEFILSGNYEPDEKLPSIKELGVALKVGQTTVREALRYLESMGLVKIQHGSGVYVGKAARFPLLVRPIISSVPLSERTFEDLIRVRKILEGGAAELAAQHATPAQVLALRHLLQKMEESIDQPEEFSRYNAAYHMLVAESSGSEIIPLFLNSVRELIVRHQKRLNTLDEVRQRSLQFHQRIFDAIAARRPDSARREMEAHLGDIETSIAKARAR